jgi:hypothetical protein
MGDPQSRDAGSAGAVEVARRASGLPDRQFLLLPTTENPGSANDPPAEVWDSFVSTRSVLDRETMYIFRAVPLKSRHFSEWLPHLPDGPKSARSRLTEFNRLICDLQCAVQQTFTFSPLPRTNDGGPP